MEKQDGQSPMKQKEDVKKEKREHIFNKLEERCAISLNG